MHSHGHDDCGEDSGGEGRSDAVRPGEIVTCRIDRLMLDSIDPDFCAAIDEIGIKRAWDPERVIIIHDHEVPPASIGVANMYAESRRRAKRFGIKHFFDMGNHGISHQFFVENGFALPGQLIVGNDSHTTTYGALNAAVAEYCRKSRLSLPRASCGSGCRRRYG